MERLRFGREPAAFGVELVVVVATGVVAAPVDFAMLAAAADLLFDGADFLLTGVVAATAVAVDDRAAAAERLRLLLMCDGCATASGTLIAAAAEDVRLVAGVAPDARVFALDFRF